MEYPWIRTSLGLVAPTFEILTEINLALFYFGGAYYDPVKRILGVRQVSAYLISTHRRYG
jgi:peroxin-10